MKTQIHNKLDLRKYLDTLDPAGIPSDKEIDDAVMKRLTKSHIVLTELSAGEAVQAGDTVTLRLESALPKFNKAKLPVTVGTGLYDKELEAALVGKTVGESGTVAKNGETVAYEILSAKRKTVPAPTDAMAAEQGIEGADTVEKFRAHLAEEKISFAVGSMAGQIMQDMLQDAETDEPADEELDRLGELEAGFFKKIYLEEKGIDLDQLSPEEFQSNMGCGSFADFVAMRRDWYKVKVKQCLALGSALDVELTGRYDPMGTYDSLSNLQDELMKRVKEDLLRRKN